MAENSLAWVELEDSCTVIPVRAGVPPAVTSSTVIGPRSGLAVAAPATAGEVMTRPAPAGVDPGLGSPPAPRPGPGRRAGRRAAGGGGLVRAVGLSRLQGRGPGRFGGRLGRRRRQHRER